MKKFLGICAALGLLAAADDAECMLRKKNEWTYLGDRNATEVTVSDGKLRILEGACSNMENLQKVILPDSIQSIRAYAFQNCVRLTEIILPEDTKFIGECAFENCVKLSNIVLPSRLEAIRKRAFKGCSNLLVVNIPNNVTEISESSFENCLQLREITLSQNIQIIGKAALKGCKSLSKINILGTPTIIIGDEAFSGCESLVNFFIPGSVTTIGESAFKDCINLVRLEYKQVSNGDFMIKSAVFENCPKLVQEWKYSGDRNAAKVEIPKDVRWIAEGSFMNMPYLENVILPDGLKIIDANAFNNCPKLISIFIPNNVEKIGNFAFKDCESLAMVQLGVGSSETGLVLGDGAFSGCSKLTDFIILRNVLSIGEACFLDCVGLSELSLPNSVTTIGRECFSGCMNLRELRFPSSVTNIGYGCFWGCRFYSISFESDGEAPLTTDEDAFANCTTENGWLELPPRISSMPTFTDLTRLAHICIPGSVEIIPEGAFNRCSSVRSIFFYDSATPLRISTRAFIGLTNLRNISFPVRLTNIDEFSFIECNNLTRIEVGTSTNIQSYAFGSSKISEVFIVSGNNATKGSIKDFAFPNQKIKVYADLTLLRGNNVSLIQPEEMNSYLGKHMLIGKEAFTQESRLYSRDYYGKL